MECAEITNRLVELLYDELATDSREAVEKHLETCAACAAEYSELLRTRNALNEWPAADERGSVAPIIRMSPTRAALTGAAAALLLVCGLALAVADTHYADGRLVLAFGASVAPIDHEETKMAEFFLLLHETTDAFADATPEQMEQTINDYRTWAAEAGEKGQLVGGEKFVDDGGQLIAQRGGRINVSDPIHTDALERIGGFFRIRAEDYEHAVAISKTCPHIAKYGQAIEVRLLHRID